MLKIFVFRHGESEDNRDGILCGHRDSSLTEDGEKQVATTARRIKRAGACFDVIYCSPLLRAHRSAEIVAKITNSPKPVVWRCLIERAYGGMEGKSWREMERLPKQDVYRTENGLHLLKARDAETFPQLDVRAQTVLRNVALKHRHGNILLVCHGTLGRALYGAYYGIPWQRALVQFRLGNAEVIELSTKADPENPFVFRGRRRTKKGRA